MKWQVCPGMGGSFPPEQLAGLLRNHWQVTAGIRILQYQPFYLSYMAD
jgi:hypothetical protein